VEVVNWIAAVFVVGLGFSELLLIIRKFPNTLQTQRRTVYSVLHHAFLFSAEADIFDAE
jgi:hypothetical protein